MKNREKEKITKPFYKTSKKLLGLKIKTKEDAIGFLVGVNNLAKEILISEEFIEDLGKHRFEYSRKITDAVNLLLGYGLAISKSKLSIFKNDYNKTQIKNSNLKYYYNWNPGSKNVVEVIERETTVFFMSLGKKVEKKYLTEEKAIALINKKFEEDKAKQALETSAQVKIQNPIIDPTFISQKVRSILPNIKLIDDTTLGQFVLYGYTPDKEYQIGKRTGKNFKVLLNVLRYHDETQEIDAVYDELKTSAANFNSKHKPRTSPWYQDLYQNIKNAVDNFNKEMKKQNININSKISMSKAPKDGRKMILKLKL